MNLDLKQYPLMQKACRRQSMFFRASIGMVEPAFKRQVARIVDAAEKYLDLRLPHEKEGVMVIALMMISPGILADKDNMTAEYSSQIAAAAKVMMQGGMEEAIKTSQDLQEGLMIVVASVAEDFSRSNIEGSMSDRGIANMRAMCREMSLISPALAVYIDRLTEDLSKLVYRPKPPSFGPVF